MVSYERHNLICCNRFSCAVYRCVLIHSGSSLCEIMPNFLCSVVCKSKVFGAHSEFICQPHVEILSAYMLDDRATEVRSPAEARGFFL
jgi:hypothetical protein